MKGLSINEMFISTDGEINFWGQGRPTVFIRVQGCNLNCKYCDTPETQKIYKMFETPIRYIADKVLDSRIKKVTITGGEPLLYRENIFDLINILLMEDDNIVITVETNGTIPISGIYNDTPRVQFIIDFKDFMTPKNFYMMHANVFGSVVKFMVSSLEEFKFVASAHDWLRDRMDNATFAISPIHGMVTEQGLLNWMLEVRHQFIFVSEMVINTQIHKYIYPEGEKNNVLI